MTDLSQQLITEEEGPSSPTVYYVNGVAHIGRGVCVDSRLHVEGLPSAVLHQLDALKLAEATNLAQKLPGYFQCNEVRQAILVSMCYQLGNLSLWPHLRAALSAGDWEAAAEAMRNSRWVEQTPARAKRAISMMLTGQWQPKE